LVNFLFIIAVSFNVLAQTPQKIEQELSRAIREVQKYSAYGSNYDGDKLDKANELFEKTLLKYTKNAATLKYNFPKLGNSIIIATSADGKFRTYSWDTESGGTMHNYSVVFQYQGADGKVYSRTDKPKDESEFGSFIYSIFSVSGKSGKIYALCSTFIGSTSDHYGSVGLYKIKGNELIDKVNLFKTAKGLTDSISFEYNFFSVVERPERPLKLIAFDEKTSTIKIPVIIKNDENEYGTVTDKFINYRFNGMHFVKVN
jgi:hypothetical protein